MPELLEDYPEEKAREPLNAIQTEKSVQNLRDYRADYHKRWQATEKLTNTGKSRRSILWEHWLSL